MDDDRLALRIETTDGDQSLIIDLASGEVISTVEIAGPGAAPTSRKR